MSKKIWYVGANPLGAALTTYYNKALLSGIMTVTTMVTVTVFAILVTLAIDNNYLRDSATALYWPRDAYDDYAFASLQAKRTPAIAPAPRSLVLVGTAAMREGLLPSRVIADRLEERKGHSVPVVNLMMGGQSALEAAALVREVAPSMHGVLVLGLSPSRMAASGAELQGLIDHPRLAFWNDGIQREAEAMGLKIPVRTGVSLWDNFQFYGIRFPGFVVNLLSGHIPENNVQTYLGRGHEDEEKWSKDIATLSSRLGEYDKNFGANIASYRRIIRWIKDNHYDVEVIILEIPLNPKALAVAVGPSFYPDHVQNLESFCRQEGCRYVNANTGNLIPEDDFFDWSHLSTQKGKEIYTDTVLKEISEGL